MKWRRACSRCPRARAGMPCSPAASTPAPQALRDHLFDLRKKGFTRLFQAGRIFEFSTPESLLDIDFSKPVFVLVDRIAIGPGSASAPGRYRRNLLSRSRRGHLRERRRARPDAALQREVPVQDLRHGVREPEPILFSFNSPVGACPRCQGFGNTIDFDMDRVFPTNRFRSMKARWSRGPSPSSAPGSAISASPPAASVRFRDALRRPDRRRARDRRTISSAASSITWKPRSTSCTCASS